MDISGDHLDDVKHDIQRQRLDQYGNMVQEAKGGELHCRPYSFVAASVQPPSPALAHAILRALPSSSANEKASKEKRTG